MLWMGRIAGLSVLLFAVVASTAFAEDGASETAPTSITQAGWESEINGADVAWMLTSSALVLMMTAPGLALFYGGLVRKKNILSVMMQCFFLMGIMSIVWALWGYSLAFGQNIGTGFFGGFVGGTDYLFLDGVIPFMNGDTADVPMAGSIPRSVHMVFQMMFFIITPALIAGAYAERMKFSTMVVFSVLWGTFVYCPIAHWVWADDGWLFNAPYEAFDFAGGTVVHISSGFSALLISIMLGKRIGFGTTPMPPHNLTYTCIGAALLWVGWFGFNAGSAGGANAAAANAFVATHMAAAAGVIAWAGAEWIFRGKPSVLGACSGAVAGLVCITPACGVVNPLHGIILGLCAGLVCYFACATVKSKFGYDDSLDAFGVHGVGGTLGAMLTGVFATPTIAKGAKGLFTDNPSQLINQAISIVAAGALALIGTFILIKILDATMGLRVTEEEEIRGLDVTQHDEEGYIFL
ncbi:Ammonium transporter NrgA [Symmachiella dynata]|uniref:Ammonium transporter n=1 Tax=Symmachiella dynata TaxID=2527995 RepID=A0A517ZNK1_9PLAN|nr:Ammonium transporter NrgA [Symmachiella dynata]